MELVAENLFRSLQEGISASGRIFREDRRSGKSEDVIVPEIPVHFDGLFLFYNSAAYDAGVHVAELAAVAFVEDQDDVAVAHRMFRVFGDEYVQLLDSGDDDLVRMIVSLFIPVFQLSLQDCGAGVGSDAAFFEALVFFDGLIVKILAVDHEEDLVDIREIRGQLGCLEGSQGLAAAGGMPYIAAGLDGSGFPVIGRNFDAVENPLGSHDLIGPHHHQNFLGGKDTVFRQNVQQRVSGEEGLCEVQQIGNDAVAAVGPVGSELKTVGSLHASFSGAVPAFPDMAEPGGVGIVFRVCAVGDDENLYIFVESRARPEAVPLVAVDLIESLPDGHAAAFQFHVNERQTVDQNRHVVAGVMPAAALFVLIDDLQAVVVNILLVDERDIHGSAVLPGEILHIVFLNPAGLFHDAVVFAGDPGGEKALPLPVGETVVIEFFQLFPQIVDEIFLVVNIYVLVSLLTQHFDESPFQRRFTLISVRTPLLGFVFRYNGAFAGGKESYYMYS